MGAFAALAEGLAARLAPIDAPSPAEGGGADLVEVDQAIWLPLSSLRRAELSEIVRRVFKGEWREWRAYPSPVGLPTVRPIPRSASCSNRGPR